mmetsp:Transcript_21156/g.60180  ORF Transcript_21156/g.60180 Transcript_21156/m.60180 type:complete len:329 (-) Transcript_21156:31-1017(-)
MGDVEIEMCMSPYSPSETFVLRLVTITGAALSACGCLFIMVSYCAFHATRTFPYKLVLMLSIANLGSSMAYFIGLPGPEDKLGDAIVCSSTVACYVAAVMTQFFDLASFLWIATIAFNIYLVMVLERGREVEGNESKYHLFAWGAPLIACALIAFMQGFGDAGLWCWIPVNKQALRFTFYYLPLVLVFIYTSVSYACVARSVQNRTQQAVVNMRLRLYVLVFVFVRIWSVIHRTQNYLSGEPAYALALLHSLFSPLQGFANALVYGCNKQVVAQYCSLARRPESSIELERRGTDFANADERPVQTSQTQNSSMGESVDPQDLEPISLA